MALNTENKQEVKLWQSFLRSIGYDIASDGIWGPKTRSATAAFQTSASIKDDGIVGKNTIKTASEWGLNWPAKEITTKTVADSSDSHKDLFKGDAISKANQAMLSRLAPRVQRKALHFLDLAERDGVRLKIVQGLRTFAEQDALYAKGRTKSGRIVTNAKGGQSIHNYGLAFDAAPVIDGVVSWDEKQYANFGKWAKAAGLEWGGNWKKFVDLPHLQDTGDLKLKDIVALFKVGGLAKVWGQFE